MATIDPEFLDCEGEVSSNRKELLVVDKADVVAKAQTNRDWSSDCFIISSRSLLNADLPSPYRSGTLTPNKPSRLYAISSSLIMVHRAAQDIRVAAL
jgi:hypothetical protein